MTVVAVYQIYLSQNSTLTQWKGGGFGMYATVHPNLKKVTINDSLVNLDIKSNVDEKVFLDSYYKFLLYPNKKTLKSFVKNSKYCDLNSLNVKVYDLDFDIKNNKATYAKVTFEFVYKKDK